MSQNNRLPRQSFGRLNLEQLEAREVPATLQWMGVTSNFADSQNWKAVSGSGGGVPGPSDVIRFSGVPSSWYLPPTPNRSVTFPSSGSGGGPLSFVGIEIIDNYSGTITFPANVSFWRYTQTTGSTSQAAGTAVSVTGGFTWTGGAINIAPALAYMDLKQGATGMADAGVNSLNLGSTFRLLGAAQQPAPVTALSVLSGTYNIRNNAGFEVNNRCSLAFQPDPADAPRQGGGANPQPLPADVNLSDSGTEKKGGSVIVEEGGLATYKPRARPANSTAPARYKADGGYLVNRGGKVVIEDRTEVHLGGEYQVPDGFNWSAVTGTAWTDSKWEMQAACSILTAKGTMIGAGTLKILPAIVASTGNPSMTEKVATIGLLPGSTADYALVVKGTAVVSMPQGSGAPYLTLAVGGNFGWSGGEIKLALSAGDTQCDKVTATGNIEISGTPKLSLRWVEASMLNTAVDTIWELMKSTDGKITGAVNANWYDDPNTKVVMDVSISGDEKKLRAIKQANKP
jgi:hypothetical protein